MISGRSSVNANISYKGWGESTIYNHKCKMFDSALRKIDLENFVIHSKVDEFILMRQKSSPDLKAERKAIIN